jgi:hypothetical protein
MKIDCREHLLIGHRLPPSLVLAGSYHNNAGRRAPTSARHPSPFLRAAEADPVVIDLPSKAGGNRTALNHDRFRRFSLKRQS